MADRRPEPSDDQDLRPASLYADGPLGSSGAAPERGRPEPGQASPPPDPANAARAAATPESAPAMSESTPAITEPVSAAGEPAATSGPAAELKPAADAQPTAQLGPGAADEPVPADTSVTAGGPVAGVKPPLDGTPAGDAVPGPATVVGTGPLGAGSVPAGAAAASPTAVPAAPVPATAVPATAASGRRGGTVVRVLRRAHPVQAMRTAGRSTVAWARRPAGRLIVPAVLTVVLIAVAGTAGAYLVPEAISAVPAPGATPAGLPQGTLPGSAAPGPGLGSPASGALPGTLAPGAAPSASLPPTSTLPGGTLPPGTLPPGTLPPGTLPPAAPATGTPTGAVVPGVRPADALAGWAQQVGTRVGIPVVAVQAYGYAELVLSRTAPSCRLSWTTIAAIAFVESSHGSYNNAVLGADGQVQPPIVGLPLDGKGGRQLISDTDRGGLDGDAVYDRAMGPLQFIPTTWRENAVDADNNGITDPNDIDDASLAAAMYLCKDGHDMSTADDWWDAILSYNDVRPYAQKVFTQANDYGVRSRT